MLKVEVQYQLWTAVCNYKRTRESDVLCLTNKALRAAHLRVHSAHCTSAHLPSIICRWNSGVEVSSGTKGVRITS